MKKKDSNQETRAMNQPLSLPGRAWYVTIRAAMALILLTLVSACSAVPSTVAQEPRALPSILPDCPTPAMQTLAAWYAMHPLETPPLGCRLLRPVTVSPDGQYLEGTLAVRFQDWTIHGSNTNKFKLRSYGYVHPDNPTDTLWSIPSPTGRRIRAIRRPSSCISRRIIRSGRCPAARARIIPTAIPNRSPRTNSCCKDCGKSGCFRRPRSLGPWT